LRKRQPRSAEAERTDPEGTVRSAASQRRSRFRILMAALTVVLLAAIVMSAALGAARLSPGQVVPAAIHRFLPQGGASQESSAFPNWAPGLLWGIRFPRIAMALVVGLALSTAGATFQGVFRNPLAEPYLLGVSAGAGLGATVAIVWKPLASLGIWTLPVAAFVGATLSAFMVYRLATFSGKTSTSSLLLSGVAVGSTFTAMISLLMVTTRHDLRTVIMWLMGGLTTAEWSDVYIAAPVTLLGFLLMLAHANRMNLMLMGEDRAGELGVDGQRTRTRMLIVASITTAAAVAFSGLIGFVGLMVPHMIRLIIGPDHRYLLPATALFGALFLLTADTAARTIFAPAEIPVGIITAFVGGPFFLYLLRLRKGV